MNGEGVAEREGLLAADATAAPSGDNDGNERFLFRQMRRGAAGDALVGHTGQSILGGGISSESGDEYYDVARVRLPWELPTWAHLQMNDLLRCNGFLGKSRCLVSFSSISDGLFYIMLYTLLA